MIDYRIIPEQRLIAICNWGEYSVEEVTRFSLKLRSDPYFSQSYDAIVDTTDLQRPYSKDDIHELSKPRIDINMPVGSIAVIASSDIIFGMSRMHEIISETESPHNIYVFRDNDSALKWLDREDLDIESIFKEIKREIT